MRNKNIKLFIWLTLFSGFVAQAQTNKANPSDSLVILTKNPATKYIDEGIRSEQNWRNTGAVYTITGQDLARTNAGNLLNTLQGIIPGLTVATGSGEPGYDNPTLYLRGQSSWNIAGNALAIYLDGFQVDMNALAALSPAEIETVTLLKDAAATAIYGFDGGAGVLSIRTKEGIITGKTKIEVNARYGTMSPIALPKVMNAYSYVTAYNKALQNDGLPIKYYNPNLYKANDDPFHPNVNWYDKVLTNNSSTQDYNISFRGGTSKARFFVLGGFTDFLGAYKDADIIGKDYGTNAKYDRINLRANLDLQLNKNLAVKATISGITEDRATPELGTTPGGQTGAPGLFAMLLQLPEAAFPVKNLNGTWGNNSVYNYNPVELLRNNGVYSSHTRYLQTNVSFKQKLDALVKGLALSGGISFANVYQGIYEKKFSVFSYQVIKDAYDNPVFDASGNVTYNTLGSISSSINDAGSTHWNRNSSIIGFDYDRSFGKHSFTGMLKYTRNSYVHDGQTYAVVEQGARGAVSYDYAQKYIADFSFAYLGSGDFQAGHRYGFFPAVGLGWIASNEEFLKNNKIVTFLKLRASYGRTGNTNENYRFLYERWASSTGGIDMGTTNSWYGGRTEGPYPNSNFTWESKQTANVGVDLTLLKKLNATVDVFNEKRTDILEPVVGVPSYTGFSFQSMNTGEVSNKGFEVSLQFHDKTKRNFEYYAGAYVAYARNKITKKAENAQPYNYLYQQGYRINEFRALKTIGFYQVSDFDASGNLLPTLAKSTYGPVHPGDLKYVDVNGDGIINDYDKVPMKFAKLPEMTIGFNLGFKYAGFDFNAFIQGVMNRTISLLDDAAAYIQPLAGNNNITVFSNNPWTPETAKTATSPRLSTLVNNNNTQEADFWLRSGNFFKLRSVEIGYTLPVKTHQKIDDIRFFLIGNNLLGNKIEGLDPERLSMGYPLMKTVTLGVKAKF